VRTKSFRNIPAIAATVVVAALIGGGTATASAEASGLGSVVAYADPSAPRCTGGPTLPAVESVRSATLSLLATVCTSTATTPLVASALYGVVSIDPSGQISYRSDYGFHGRDRITVSVPAMGGATGPASFVMVDVR